jgi:hypothetical protein
MSQMGSTSRVTSCDLFICETGKGLASVENVRDTDREPSRSFHVTLELNYGKVGECEATLTTGPGVWWLIPFLRVGTVVHVCRVLKA